MTLKPCLDCGLPSPASRCPEHTVDTKVPADQRGYDGSWKRLSKRARRLQPFCLECGAAEDLQTDHTPEAWERKAAGKPIRLSDVRVLCGPCNRAAGAARGPSATRGGIPSGSVLHPPLRRGERYTPRLRRDSGAATPPRNTATPNAKIEPDTNCQVRVLSAHKVRR